MVKLNPATVAADPVWRIALREAALVYAMRQVHHLDISGHSSAERERYRRSGGICFGIACRWLVLRRIATDFPHRPVQARVPLASGSVVDRAFGICDEIAKGPAQVQYAMEAQPGSLSLSLEREAALGGLAVTGLVASTGRVNLARSLVGLAAGRWLFVSSDHAMAVERTGERYRFFDPNFGVVQVAAAAAGRSVLVRFVEAAVQSVGYVGPYQFCEVK